jgi:hypothetical protein
MQWIGTAVERTFKKGLQEVKERASLYELKKCTSLFDATFDVNKTVARRFAFTAT